MNLEYYQSLPKEELKKRVSAAKKRFGKGLLILGHYYQSDDVIEFADHQGDSYTLAKKGSENLDAEFIVFCGVHFMAESSAILARRGQRVFIPDPYAGCPLADMAGIDEIENAWRALEACEMAEQMIPITYINSSAELKAFCGSRGGVVCTSSNAGKAFDWALSKNPPTPPLSKGGNFESPPLSKGGNFASPPLPKGGKGGFKIFFFPDEHLGRNTANAKGFKKSEMVRWDPLEDNGGISNKELLNAKIILWNGHCHVHTLFLLEHVKNAREEYPNCIIAVHPECTEDVVNASDAVGSTAFLKKFAEETKSGSTVVIGTEINLVNRLAKQNTNKTIVPLARSLCPNMFKSSLADLCYTLENMPEENEIKVPEFILKDAKTALERMLAL